jgi:DNA-binding PadR family transcriptional regulator
MDKELLKGSIDIIILLLTRTHAIYGYEIAKRTKYYTNSMYEMGEGTLYPALKRLEDKKLITSYWGDAEKGGRRKYFQITELGKSELEAKYTDWKIITELITNILKEEP